MNDAAVKKVRDALSDLQGVCSPRGERDARQDIIRYAPALLAALDEVNTDRQRLQGIINRQKVTAEERLALKRDRRAVRTRRRLIDERDQAVATAVRWEDRASFLEKSHDAAVAQVEAVKALCTYWEKLAPGDRYYASRVRAHLADQDNGDTEKCALCGHTTADHSRSTLVTLGGSADGQQLCHQDDHSCYHRWTVYQERPAPRGPQDGATE